MNIGDLDQRVTLQVLASTNDAGDLKNAWTELAMVYAKVITDHGSEAFQSARTEARETIRVLIRYRTDVDTNARLEWMGQQYYISAVDRSGRRAGELWLTAQVVGKT